MKKFIFTCFILLVYAFYAENSNSKKIEPINDNDFKIKMKSEEIFLNAIYNNEKESNIEKYSNNFTEAIVEDENITFFYTLADNKISYIKLNNSYYSTIRGVKVGDNYLKIMEKYGKCNNISFSEPDTFYHYYYKGYILEFICNKDIITCINLEII